MVAVTSTSFALGEAGALDRRPSFSLSSTPKHYVDNRKSLAQSGPTPSADQTPLTSECAHTSRFDIIRRRTALFDASEA
jgi:hypothetical protein